MSATDPHDAPPGLLAGLGAAVLDAIRPFDDQPMLGVPDAAKPAVIAALAGGHGGPVLVLTPTPSSSAELTDALPLWLSAGGRVRLLPFPARESTPYDRQPPAPDLVEARLTAIDALRSGSPIIVADVDAAAQRTAARSSAPLRVAPGASAPLQTLIRTLDGNGYERARVVVGPSTYAVRGGIIDFWPPTVEAPIRLELFGDDIESIRQFDPRSQRSTAAVDSVDLRPAREWSQDAESQPLIDRLLASVDGCAGSQAADREADGNLTAEAALLALDLSHLRAGDAVTRPDFWTQFLAPSTIFDHLGEDALIILGRAARSVRASGGARPTRPARPRDELERGGSIPRGLPHPWLSGEELQSLLDRATPMRRSLSRLAGGEQRLPFRPTPRLAGKLAQLFESLRESQGQGSTLLVSLQEARLSELMVDLGLPLARLQAEIAPAASVISVGRAALSEGWQLDDPSTGERPGHLDQRYRNLRLRAPASAPAVEQPRGRGPRSASARAAETRRFRRPRR